MYIVYVYTKSNVDLKTKQNWLKIMVSVHTIVGKHQLTKRTTNYK